MYIYRIAEKLFLFCSFFLRSENKSGTNDSRQPDNSRNFNVTTEGLRSSSLELYNGQKLNTLNCRG